jgi:hypothetical protein
MLVKRDATSGRQRRTRRRRPRTSRRRRRLGPRPGDLSHPGSAWWSSARSPRGAAAPRCRDGLRLRMGCGPPMREGWLHPSGVATKVVESAAVTGTASDAPPTCSKTGVVRSLSRLAPRRQSGLRVRGSRRQVSSPRLRPVISYSSAVPGLEGWSVRARKRCEELPRKVITYTRARAGVAQR